MFDEPNLVSAAGLVPVLALAERAGLAKLAQQHLSVPTDKGANAGLKVASLVAGMVAGADSIDDMGLLRHGGMGRIFAGAYAPSTLGSFLRAFRFGHVRQLDAVAARFLSGLANHTPLLESSPGSPPGVGVVIDVDDTIVEVHGYRKQGAGFGYSKVRGLNALLATVSTPTAAPVIVAHDCAKAHADPREGRNGWSPTRPPRSAGCCPAAARCCGPTRPTTAAARSGPPSAAGVTCRSPSAKTQS